MTGQVYGSLAEVAEQWQPDELEIEGVASAERIAALADLLACAAPQSGAPIPPLWHEVLLREPIRISEMGVDGHPVSSGLLPPIVNRRRLFGGSELRLVRPLRAGEQARRSVRAVDVRLRAGRSGDLLLVTEEHEWTVGGELRLRERRAIIYRSEDRRSAAPVLRAAGRDASALDERSLFVFSALTNNAHRVHYDAQYTSEVEGHPALLVHGPLTALLAAEAVRTWTARPILHFDYRLTAPCYVGDPLSFVVTSSRDGHARVIGSASGRECLTATVEFGPG